MKPPAYCIIDCGSTKSDWTFVSGERYLQLHAKGYNPVKSQTLANPWQIDLTDALFEHHPQSIYYYGAGVINQKYAEQVVRLLQSLFPETERIEAHSDLIGAARAGCQKESGLIAIAGTGSNAALYDGEKITKQSVTLGFPLGDEGSGNHLGKLLIQSYFYCDLPQGLKKAFEITYPGFSKAILLEKMNSDQANAYLASFTPFLYKHREHIFIKSLIQESFHSFIKTHVVPLSQQFSGPIWLVGSIAYFFQNEWKQALAKYGLSLTGVVQKPINRLVDFHWKN